MLTTSRPHSFADLSKQTSEQTSFYPLSLAQEGIWFIEQLEPGTPVHNLAGGLRLRGHLNMSALRRAVDAIVLRHETLRTRFSAADGTVVQQVALAASVAVAVEDLRAVQDQLLERAAYDCASRERCSIFDLQEGPLFRLKVIRLRDEDHILVCTMHHLVSDAWSIGLFFEELKQFYIAYTEHRECKLQPLPMQYGAYAAWQRGALAGAELKQKLQHWKRKLAGSSQALELPSDRARPSTQTFEGASCSAMLASGLCERLAAFAQRGDVTLFTLLLTAFFVLLHRYSHQEDICVGVPVAGRGLLEAEPLIGLFANTLVIRGDLSGNPRFRDLLAQTHENLLEAYAYQDIPVESVLAELKAPRSLSYNPIFQVVMTMLRAPKSEQRFGALTAAPYITGTSASRFDLAASIIEAGDGTIWCQFEFNTALFDRSRLSRMMDQYQTLLTSIVNNPEQRISDLDLLTPEELWHINASNDTGVAFPAVCSHELIANQAAQTPDRIAAAYEDQQLTYAGLEAAIERVAALLHVAGAGPGLRIAICVERSLEMLAGILAIWEVGCTLVALDPDDPDRRLRFMLEDADVSFVLTTSEIASRLRPYKPCVLIRDYIQPEPGDRSGSSCNPLSAAYIIYTSGSTGTPKGVCVSHRSLVNLLCSMRREPGFNADDKLLALTSLSFDISLLELLLPLISGGEVIVASEAQAKDATNLLNLIRSREITIIQTTPSRWRLLIEAGWTRDDGEFRVWSGGERLTSGLARQLLERSSEVWNLYGPTETTIWSSVSRVRKDSPVLIGKPISNTQFYVLDRHSQPAPRGARGELCIAGDGLAEGYWRRPELTAEKFVRPPIRWAFLPPLSRLYRTGDEVVYRGDGEIEYLGRLDSQRKVRGRRIELGEIESALGALDGVRQVVAAVREDDAGDERLIAYVVPAAGVALTTSRLQNALKDQLPEYMIPAITFVDAVPLTTNGKVDRNRLPVPAETRHAGRPACSDSERQLAAIWQAVLGISEINVTDNFFDLGGHSLLAVRLLAKVEKVFGKRLSISSFFKAQTVEKMAALLDEGMPHGSRLLVEMKPEGTRHPLFLVPGSGGDVLPYAEVPRLLPSDQSVYGLQSVGLDGTQRPLERIEDIAHVFLAQIRSVQPRGPYQLAGFCIGGMVVFEIAQRMIASGDEVTLLALIETWPPSYIPVYQSDHPARRLSAKLRRVPQHLRDMLRLPLPQALRYLSGRVTTLQDIVPVDPSRDLVRRSNYLAASRYVPSRYPGDIVIVLPDDADISETDPRLFWRTLAGKACRVVQVSGDRGTLLKRPHVELLARRLNEELLASSLLAAR